MTTLKHIHEHDLVHCNIGLDSVVIVTNGWFLIGCEIAERTKQLVWCEWKLLPDGVKHRIELTHAKDLQQLGMLIKAAAVCADVSTAKACPYSAMYLTVTQSMSLLILFTWCLLVPRCKLYMVLLPEQIMFLAHSLPNFF